MRHSSIFSIAVILALFVVPFVLWSARDTSYVRAESGGVGQLGFGLHVAGTYFGDVVVTEGPTFALLDTLTADGTFVTETAVDFGAGGGGPFAFRSGGRGNWRRTGPDEVAITYLHFNYDPDGTLTALEKIVGSLVFDGDFETAQGEGTFSVYAPDQDPFGDDPPFLFMGTAEVTLRRVPVE